jgi:hypothetical protein
MGSIIIKAQMPSGTCAFLQIMGELRQDSAIQIDFCKNLWYSYITNISVGIFCKDMAALGWTGDY